MKNLKYLLLLLIVACSSPKVVYDYDTKEDFTKYKTFNFFEDAGQDLNELDKKRVLQAIKESLIAKGMQQDSVPDIYIHILAEQHKVDNRNTLGVGIGGGGNVGFGISAGIPIGGRKVNQQITIDFVDAKSDQLIWQGIAEKPIKEKTTPNQRDLYFNEIITKVLSEYPPKKKK